MAVKRQYYSGTPGRWCRLTRQSAAAAEAARGPGGSGMKWESCVGRLCEADVVSAPVHCHCMSDWFCVTTNLFVKFKA